MRYRLRTLLIALTPLLTLPLLGQEKSDPGAALYGEWEVVEEVYRGKVQDFRGMSGGTFIFDSQGVIILLGERPTLKERELFQRIKGTKNGFRHATTVRQNELDIENWFPGNKPLTWTTKAYYELKDGKLRILWGGNENERPTDFDEAYKDRTLTYYVLKKVK